MILPLDTAWAVVSVCADLSKSALVPPVLSSVAQIQDVPETFRTSPVAQPTLVTFASEWIDSPVMSASFVSIWSCAFDDSVLMNWNSASVTVPSASWIVSIVFPSSLSPIESAIIAVVISSVS